MPISGVKICIEPAAPREQSVERPEQLGDHSYGGMPLTSA
jgi:hypothetical protein